LSLTLPVLDLVLINWLTILKKKQKEMKSYKLDEAEDLLIGKKGTKERDEYEFELKLELIGDMIKTARKKKKLTYEQLGELVGVKKAQISRLENSTGNVTLETVMRIFNALGAKLNLNIRIHPRNPIFQNLEIVAKLAT